MKPAPFEYHRPSTVGEAVELLATLDEAKVLAGGQSLVPLMNFRLAVPEHLVDITAIAELATLHVTEAGVNVGATITHARVLGDEAVARTCPILPEALTLVAHEVIRNRGTVCGSLAHADPSGELTAVLALLEGTVTLTSRRGTRTVEAGEFLQGSFESCCEYDELVIGALFPATLPETGTAFVEVARRHGDYAVCGSAVTATIDPDHTVRGARLALISVASTPLVLDLGAVVSGRPAAAIDRGEIYDHVADRVDPPDDLHGTSDYRRHLAGVTAVQALARAVGRANPGILEANGKT